MGDLDSEFNNLWLEEEKPTTPKARPVPVAKPIEPTPPKPIEKTERKVEKPVIKKPPVEKPKTVIIPSIPVKERFADLEVMVKLVIDGVRPALFISGMSGTSKSFTVMNVLDENKLVEGKDWFLCKGSTTPVAIYRTMYENNGKIIVYDDCDSVMDSKESLNILKSGLDSTPVRRIAWMTTTNFNPRDKTEEEIDELVSKGKYPTFFDFTGRIIFISNIKFDDIDTAIKTRCLTVNVDLTKDEFIEFMRSKLDSIRPDIALDVKKDILDKLIAHYTNGNKDFSFRTLVTAIELQSTGMERWLEIVSRYG